MKQLIRLDIDVLDFVNKLQNSHISNYLESSERLFLSNISQKIEIEETSQLETSEIEKLNKIISKYLKYLT